MRIFIALAAGLVSGVVFTEVITAAVQLLTPESDITRGLAGETALPLSANGGLLLAWLVGGTVTGSLATAVGQSRIIGALGAIIISCAAALTFQFSAGGAVMFYLTPAVAAAGALCGIVAAHRLQQ